MKRRKPVDRKSRAFPVGWVAGLLIVAGLGAGAATLRAQAGTGISGHPASAGATPVVPTDPEDALVAFHAARRDLTEGDPSGGASVAGASPARVRLEGLAERAPGRARTLARILLSDLDRQTGTAGAARWLEQASREGPDLEAWSAVVAGGATLEAKARSIPADDPLATLVWLEAARSLKTVPAADRLGWLKRAAASGPGDLAGATLALRLELGDPDALDEALGRRDLASQWVPKLRAMAPASRSPEARMRVAGALMDQGQYGPAARWLEGLPDALARYRLARCAWKTGDLARARRGLDEARRLDPYLAPRVRMTEAEIRASEGKGDEAVRLVRELARGSGKTARYALVFLLKAHLRADRLDEAAAVDAEMIRRFPDDDVADDARWRSLWRAHDAGRIADARRWASALAARSGGYRPPATFWLGRMAEDAGDAAAARRHYSEVARLTPTGYYGWRGRMRGLALDGGTDPGFRMLPGDLREPADPLSSWVPATGSLPAPSGPDTRAPAGWAPAVRLLAAAGVYPPGLLPEGQARIGLAYARGQWAEGASWAKDDPASGFPLAYAAPLFRAAGREGLDPLYLLALVKQESAFDPLSRSWVGAMGLAQLMPFTAEWVGKQLPGPPRPLTDPDWNLQLGAWYLAHAGREMTGDRILQTAAYNAGIGAAKRWRGMLPKDAEVRIEHIPYKETRHYVKKVFGYYWTYAARYRMPDLASWPRQEGTSEASR
ncbi:MAG: transglycosylase SLT domain-containing protein [Candidatus Sericytochromatia bacterium]|nr:transglycosylase SLT domain-containing protein [Candidatus Sericytochromatia bacterium]